MNHVELLPARWTRSFPRTGGALRAQSPSYWMVPHTVKTGMPNEFPSVWFDTFLSHQNAAPVDRELAFIQQHLPVSSHSRLLDIPCGIGRHTGPLSQMGYQVLGVDRSPDAVAAARTQYPAVEFSTGDMFDLTSLRRTFDGIVCLWQSFGFGSSDQNRQLLSDMRKCVRPGGRILLDVYNADAARELPAQSTEERSGRVIHTRRWWDGNRQHVDIEYAGVDGVDRHEWEVFTPSQIEALASQLGLRVLINCAWFDDSMAPSKEHLRMQLLLENP